MDCFHCGLPITGEPSRYTVVIKDAPRAMCCAGCQAVATAIVDNQLSSYYDYRTAMPRAAEALVPEELKSLALYNRAEIQTSFVELQAAHIKEASLILEGIQCAACVWLNEQHLKQLQGVILATVNYASNRLRVRWDDSQIALSDILVEIRKLGYQAHPFSAQKQESLRAQFRKTEFRRLAVAGLCAGQVMMIAVALYAGKHQGLEFASAQLLRWVSLILTIPALLVGALPFFQGAWRSIKNKQLGMDVPIVIGLVAGFVGSTYHTVQNAAAPVYFDTITMLIFFLLATRFLERNARERSTEAAESLLRLVPMMVTRIQQNNTQLVALAEVEVGDILLVKPGEVIAADGVLTQGESSADESLLTGESKPLPKGVGSQVYAGSTNYESPIHMQVTALGEHTMLASISRLLDRAQADKPKLAMMADSIASYFTVVLLVIVTLVTLFWWWHAPERTLEIVLSLLVVSCPCALSLAAPAAFAAAGSRLIQQGVLITRGHAIETLAKATHVVLDKTGTLTLGKLQLVESQQLSDVGMADCLAIAASLEQHSEHPIAKAIVAATRGTVLLATKDIVNTPGQGLQASIDNIQYYIGKPKAAAHQVLNRHSGASIVYLYKADTPLAAFVLQDTLRPQSQALVQQLRAQGLKVTILSGDSEEAVAHAAQQLGIVDWRAALSPQDKLAAIKVMQAQGDVVAMVGDGINDAPVLAAAQVSIAMGEGTQMARTSGDAVLLNQDISAIANALNTSKLGLSVMRQNFIWAMLYNAVVIPFAAAGLISPLMAAFGMSVSSLIVVLNALRIKS